MRHRVTWGDIGTVPVTSLYHRLNDRPKRRWYIRRRKKDKRSGKERQCCRIEQTKIQIACLIFREQLCRPSRMRNGLFVYALIWPDQVDVWDQVLQREPWDDQTNSSMSCWDCRLSNQTGGFFICRRCRPAKSLPQKATIKHNLKHSLIV